MENIRKVQIDLIISCILITIVIGIFSVMLGNMLVNSVHRKIIIADGLAIDYEPNINYKLTTIKDHDLSKLKVNRVNVTNNNADKVKYQVTMGPITENEEDIMVSLNDVLIRPLKNYTKVDNNYILYESTLDSGYTMILDVKMYSKKDLNIIAKYRLNVKKVGV